ncbi:hypothetical protein ACFZ8E_07380 [Methylobacterium sp. HMF5984]|uniref:hypothetical protein n=1 Tax=Methylobacterium sp. HMF5984 TaxID=3367370 RepID=UPI00385452C8
MNGVEGMNQYRMRRLARYNVGVKKWKGVVGYALPRPVIRWLQGVCDERLANENVQRATLTLANLIGRCFTSPGTLGRDPDWMAYGAVFCLARDASNKAKGVSGTGGILSHPMMIAAGVTEHYFKLAKQILLSCGFIDVVSHPFTYNSNPLANTTRRKPILYRIGKRWFNLLHARPGLKNPPIHPESPDLQNAVNLTIEGKDSTPHPFGPVGLNSGDSLPSGFERTVPENPWICRMETKRERERREARPEKDRARADLARRRYAEALRAKEADQRNASIDNFIGFGRRSKRGPASAPLEQALDQFAQAMGLNL